MSSRAFCSVGDSNVTRDYQKLKKTFIESIPLSPQQFFESVFYNNLVDESEREGESLEYSRSNDDDTHSDCISLVGRENDIRMISSTPPGLGIFLYK